MLEPSLDLAGVLGKLKRADEALTECVAPLWPGVWRVAAWMEHGPRLFVLDEVPAQEGYYYLGTDGEAARVLRPADPGEVTDFLRHLERARVILLDDHLAFPASFAERLQGITAPRPIHFAEGDPLTSVQARTDGINLLYDAPGKGASTSPLGGLFDTSSIFHAEDLFAVPGTTAATGDAEAALATLRDDPTLLTTYRLRAVLDPAGAACVAWTREDGRIRLTWRCGPDEYQVSLSTDSAPIVGGICLPGARGFDPGVLTRFLLDHALEAWRADT